MNAAVGCLRHSSRLKVEEQAGGGLEAADAAGLARNRGIRYLRQRRGARQEGCVGDLARVRRHPSEEVSEQGARGCWVGGMQWGHLDGQPRGGAPVSIFICVRIQVTVMVEKL